MSIGIWQVVLVLLIVLILFGAGKLPKVMGDLATGIKNFKRGMADDGEEEGEAKKLSAERTETVGETANLKKDEAAKG